MKTSPKMKEVIEAIAMRFEVDFAVSGTSIRLQMPGFDLLRIERVDRYRISVAHYFESAGFLIPEPDVVIFTKYQEEVGWVPIEITQSMTGYTSYVQLTDDGKGIKRYSEKGQADLAEFTEQWAQNILDQGWLENGTLQIAETLLLQAVVVEASNIGIWPEPTVDPPDMETLQEWFDEDGGCEATDGCWVEGDGTCPHGHPSWLLELGLI